VKVKVKCGKPVTVQSGKTVMTLSISVWHDGGMQALSAVCFCVLLYICAFTCRVLVSTST